MPLRPKSFILTLILTAACKIASAESQTGIAGALAGRILGAKAETFEFAEIPSVKKCNSPDIFTLESRGNKIIVSGNNANSMAVGLNYYLKNHAGTTVSWYKDDAVFIPDSFPALKEKIVVKSTVPDRFFLNYCTFGYTMPWWKWADWERLIDWMALNGVNMPLAITGQEAVWYNVWRSIGMTDEEVRGYFTGPAHLPWHRMCNIDSWQGPLPLEWIENQKELQAKIVERERQLGMRPVLPAFAGHVPALLKKYRPDAKTSHVGNWENFGKDYECTYLSPADPLYSEIQKKFLEEQTRLYGTDHIYGIDCFNEVAPPSWQPDSLKMIASSVLKSLTSVDSEARWLQMAWFFYYDKRWTPDRIKAFLSGIPKGRLINLDYYCDNKPLWEITDSFHGHDFIWCFLGNFGGTSFLMGNPRQVSSRIAKCAASGGKNFTGLGGTLEGFDLNPYLHEFIFDKAWDRPVTDEQTFETVARSRTGSSPDALAAWKIIFDSVYVQRTGCSHATLNCSRPCLKGNGSQFTRAEHKYRNTTLLDAWESLIKADGKGRDTYEFDLVNIGRQVLGNHFKELRDRFAKAYETKNIDSLIIIGAQMRELNRDISLLLACHPTFLLRRWLEDARAMSSDPKLKDYYETNARTLITYWGGTGTKLADYANRAYAELNEQFYSERWNRFIDQVISDVKAGRKFNQKEFNESIREFERNWAEPTQHRIYYLPDGDGAATAQMLLKKYAPRIRE